MRWFALTTLLLVSWSVTNTQAQECIQAVDGSCVNPDAFTDQEGVSQHDDIFYLPCGVYMAPSTLGDHTNLGIYTAVDLKKDDVVNFPEIAIPLMFRQWHENPLSAKGDGELWDRYIWEGDVANIEAYTDTDRSDTRAVFVPGVGCTVNSILDMSNIESTHGSIYDTAGLFRDTDPGIGAFSPYYGAETSAQMDIPAGSELFAAYGDTWIPWIPDAQITFNKYLDKADEFLDEYVEWYQDANQKHNVTPHVAEALWNLTSRDFPYYSKVFSNLPRADWKDVEKVLLEKNTEESEVSVPREFIRKSGVKSLDWLQQNGKCQDHIKPGRSTIAQAGRGAFAAQDLPKGSVVGYAPLIHIGKRAKEMLTIEYDIPGQEPYSNWDLIINYSFGHKNSTLILTPYGGMVNYINHHKERANVKVQWPKEELVAHKPEWLEKDVDFLRHTSNKIGLSFDYVALRDIKKGEEIFMDYGDVWQQAWDEHVETWKPVPDAHNYMHSTQFHQDYFQTRDELQSNPYPANLITMCYESYRKDTTTNTYKFLPVLRKDYSRVYCTVIERREDAPERYTYVVELQLNDGSIITVHNFDSSGLFLYDRAYSSDWHLPNVFRHPIMIPDDVFPANFMNR